MARSVYRDDPGTTVTSLDYGYELVQRPDRAVVRTSLSTQGVRRRSRVAALSKRGYEIINAKGTGMVRSPDGRVLASIAAAAKIEDL